MHGSNLFSLKSEKDKGSFSASAPIWRNTVLQLRHCCNDERCGWRRHDEFTFQAPIITTFALHHTSHHDSLKCPFQKKKSGRIFQLCMGAIFLIFILWSKIHIQRGMNLKVYNKSVIIATHLFYLADLPTALFTGADYETYQVYIWNRSISSFIDIVVCSLKENLIQIQWRARFS